MARKRSITNVGADCEDEFTLGENIERHECDGCKKCFSNSKYLSKHQINDRCGNGDSQYCYPGGCYESNQTVFDKLLAFGIVVERDRQCCQSFATWDCEALLEQLESTVQRNDMDEEMEQRLVDQNLEVEYVDEKAKKLQYRERHTIVSCAIKSSIAGHEETQFFCDADPELVVSQSFNAMMELSDANYEIEKKKFAKEFERLEVLQRITKAAIEACPNNSRREKEVLSKLERLIAELDKYCWQLTILTFNGGRYDLNLVKFRLFPLMTSGGKVVNQIAKGKNIMGLMTEELKFLDVMNYVSPGTNLAKFIKAFNSNGEEKGCFPYELLRKFDDLERITMCPPKAAFYSTLKNGTISDKEYEEVQEVWNKLPTKNLKELLRYYNSNDVAPFLVACSNMAKIYWTDFGIDIFKEAISLPGVCLQFLFKRLHQLQPTTRFGLFAEEEGELCQELYGKKSLCGGLSFIGNRIAEKGKMAIRGNANKIVKKVVGYDYNGLYLHSIMREMPTGNGIWWKLNNGTGEFERKSKSMEERLKERKCHGEVECFKFRSWQDNVYIHTAADGPQTTLGLHNYRVDGYAKDALPKSRVYNYNGCYYHGHTAAEGCLRPPKKVHDDAANHKKNDLQQQKDLEALGLEVVTIWECEFINIKQLTAKLRSGRKVDTSSANYHVAAKYNEYLKQHQKRKFSGHDTVSQTEMRAAILNGDVFGFAKVDIATKEELKEKYSDFPLIIKHAEVGRNDIGEYMKGIAEKYDLLKKPKDCLIGSYFGDGIWLMTPLLQFYKRHGVEIKKVHEVVQYDKETAFKWFGETVTEHRMEGDRDKDKAILAEVYKLLGNSAYGKCITNLWKHIDTCYGNREKAEKYSNDPLHKETVQIGDDCFEIKCRKKSINFNLPMVIGLAVYNYAKLQVLEFIYDVLFEFFDRSDYMFLESDTDSIYLALAADTLEELVLPHKRAEFEIVKKKWFVLDKTQKRVPGLLKVEEEADKFIGLCSKCYICVNDKDKVLVKAKGVQTKNRNQEILKWENFEKVLYNLEGADRTAINLGIRAIDNDVRTYVQEKNGISPIYCKRICFADGSTVPLNL